MVVVDELERGGEPCTETSDPRDLHGTTGISCRAPCGRAGPVREREGRCGRGVGVQDATDNGPGLVHDAMHGRDLGVFGVLGAQFALQDLAICPDGGQLVGRSGARCLRGAESPTVGGSQART